LREKYKDQINLYDKIVIYKFCKGNTNLKLYKSIINDFITLIKLLNSKDKENEIKGETKIYNVINDSKNTKVFIKLFEKQKS